MFRLRDKYAIAGVGETAYSKDSGTTVLNLAVEACLKAANDAGVDVKDVDGIVSYNFGDSAPAMAVATALGIPDVGYAVDFAGGGNAANLITLSAAAAMEAGLARNVLCFRAMNGRSGFRLGGGRQMQARGITQHTAPYGWITYPQAMAMWARRHMIEYGTSAEHLGQIAITFRDNAALNERAMQRTPITMDDYMASRFIVEPFRMLDICLESDGACAVLMTDAERARDMAKPPVYLMGGAYGGGPNQGEDLFDAIRWPDHSKNYAAFIADDLWASAGVGPKDIDVAEIYDCFTYSVIMQLEGLGFIKPGDGGPYCASGAIARDGALPVNTHGGLLSEAYIHGFNHVLEAVRQLRGEAGPGQVAGAEVALTTAGAMTCGSAMVLRN
ncbi:acetyl-CoA acetyltransferase [Pikeienuella piscinae]|uniref:Acetyl-CoA acetyltransferase n=1 Tax=Pikeienuella piscinae TaxID=2748098 RepID=A0A7L5C011_9RHOB|nr:acetyl-CoA acetyltransferase [Pikeienuella piscinae]QIE56713.1 acetyl-CoA acetyltransferase [Pikeienuella piscinae]